MHFRKSSQLFTAWCVLLGSAHAFAAPPHFEGFEDPGWTANMTDNWQEFDSTIARVTSGTNSIVSSSGVAHAVVGLANTSTGGPFTRFGGYSTEFQCGFVASLDVYLDPGWSDGTGFDYSVAANGQDGNHHRDFIWHVGVVSGTGLLVNASNNTDFEFNSFKLLMENGGVFHTVTSAGWYRFEQVFYDDGTGTLAVDFNLYDANDTLLYSVTRSDPSDDVDTIVGGNRYGWFTYNGITDLAVDNTSLQNGEGCGTLSLETTSCQDDTDGGAGYQIEVELWMRDLPTDIDGYQAFLSFDTNVLAYRGDLSTYTGGPFPLHVQSISTAEVSSGQLRLDGSIALGGSGTDVDSLLATLVFDVAEECTSTEVIFDTTQSFTSDLSADGSLIPTLLMNTGEFVNDDTPPMIYCPPNIVVNADAGGCDAEVDLNSTITETFDDPVVLAATQTPGTWYVDRYPPFGFTNAFFDGDNRLQHSIDASDCSPCRPAGFNSAFYDTQGRKYDTPGNTKMSIDLYVPSDWATTGRRMAGFWATGFNSSGGLTQSFGIIEFTSSPDDSGVPRFRGWNNAWIDMGLPTGFVYDAWYTLEIELVAGDWVYTVGDLSLTVPATDVGGATVEAGNIILQGHNNTAGVTYDIYWDNFAYGVGASGEDNCELASITGMRLDALPLGDPYPVGTTTIEWTAEDACGNTATCQSTVTVNDVTDVDVDITLVGSEPAIRCIHFVTNDCDVIADHSLTFVDDGNGNARYVGTVEIPCGSWDNLCMKDEQHTKWGSTSLSIVDTIFVADSAVSLEPGDTDNDGDVDIHDITLLISQFGLPEPAGGCPWDGSRGADFSNSGNVGSEDYSLLSAQWLTLSNCPCTMAQQGMMFTRVKSIHVSRLDPHIARQVDLNRDGVFDWIDVRMFESHYGLPNTLSNQLEFGFPGR